MEVEVKNPTAATNSQNGTLSFEQIKDIVGNGWALIKDPVRDGSILLGGKLLYHSRNEDEAVEEMRIMRKGHRIYMKYCGERDPNIVYLL